MAGCPPEGSTAMHFHPSVDESRRLVSQAGLASKRPIALPRPYRTQSGTAKPHLLARARACFNYPKDRASRIGERPMDLGMTPKVKPLVEKVRAMVRDEIMPLEEEYEAEIGREGSRFVYTRRQTEILEGLKAKARERGLWNFWLTASDRGYGLTTVEYAYLAEEMGWSRLAPETFNCSA